MERVRKILLQAASMCLALVLVSACGEIVPDKTTDIVTRVDHLVYATPDLDRGIDEIEKLLGVRATPGGQHPGRGTRNALVSLGPHAYLEIIGPDPGQPPPTTPRWFGIDNLTESRLVTWAANGSSLEQLQRDAVGQGIPLGAVGAGSRRRPDGVELTWKYTEASTLVGDGIVPFFIDWGESPHPARTAATGATLIGLHAEHPDPARVQQMLRRLEIDMVVEKGSLPALIAVIAGPNGRVELR